MKQLITYNGYTFPYSTMNVSSSVMYDEAHTVIGSLYTFRITGTITAPSGKNTLDTEIFNMRRTLSMPRREFKVLWTDDSSTPLYTPYYFSSNSTTYPGSTMDVAFGPKTTDLQLMKFTGGRAAIYDWTIVVFTKECWQATCDLSTPDNGCISNATSDILSFQRSYSHQIDVNGLTTRTVSGKILITAHAATNKSVDELRNKVSPPLPLNYKRTAQSFSQSPDGRELTYSITDTEQVYVLPKPATDGQAAWSMNISLGGLIHYSLSGYFSGAAETPKSELIALVGQLALAKFPIDDANLVFNERTLTESVYGNRIDFSITADSAAAQLPNKMPDFTTGLITFNISPPNDGNQAVIISPYGGLAQSSGTIAPIINRYLWDACTETGIMSTAWNQNYNPGNGVEYGVGQNRPSEGQNPYDTSGVSGSHTENPIILYNEVFSYEVDNGIVSFSPKVKNAPPIIQQVHAPKVTVVQAGYAVRYAQSAADANKNMDFPPPPRAGTGTGDGMARYIVAHSSVSPEAPEIVGDGGWNKYTVRWRYVLYRTTDAQGAKDLHIVYPDDPRRPKKDQEEWADSASDYDPMIVTAGGPVSGT